jgi:two-component system, sensor histidine kinase LadS
MMDRRITSADFPKTISAVERVIAACALAVLVLVLVLSYSAPGRAADHIVERAWLSDASGDLSLADVQGQRFTPFVKVLGRGYINDATWIRLRIDPRLNHKERHRFDDTLIVRIRPTYIDELTLFDPLQPIEPPVRLGDRVEPINVYPALSYNVSIPRGSEPRDIYLRLQTRGTSLMYVEVLPFDEALVRDRYFEIVLEIFISLIGVSLLWVVLYGGGMKDRLIASFAIKQLLAFVWIVMIAGFGQALFSQFAAPTLLDNLTSLAVLLATASSVSFDYRLLHEYRVPLSGLRLLRLFPVVSGLLVVLFVLGEARLALQVNAILSLGSVLIVFVLSCLAQPLERNSQEAPPLPKGLLVIIYGMAMVLTGSALAIILGVFNELFNQHGGDLLPELNLYGLHVHSIVTGVLMIALLSLRSRNLTRHRQHMQTQLALSEAAHRRERAHSQDQSRMLAMLAHELRTPLSVIRLRLSMLPNDPDSMPVLKGAVGDINEVIDRCLDVGRMSQDGYAVQWESLDIHDMMSAQIAASEYGSRIELTSTLMRAQVRTQVRTSPTLLRSIINNLLVNAGKYSPVGSVISVELGAQREGYEMIFANLPGTAGWPDAEQVFDKYYRSGGAHHQSGSGLGLYLVQAMCERLSGSIHYRPSATHIRFIVWLPTQPPV